MLSLYQHVTKYFLFIVVVLVILFGISNYFIIKHIEINGYKKSLKSSINAMKIYMQQVTELDKFIQDFHNKTNIRVTILDSNTDVILDSNKDIDGLENHNNRVEIIEAKKDEFGESIRYSQSLNTKYLYVASMFEFNNKSYFIRLSTDIKSIVDNIYMIWISSTIVFVFILLSGLVWLGSFNKKIKKEVDGITNALTVLSNKNYTQNFNFGYAKEFIQIGIYLNKLAKRLKKRDKQKQKYTAKIKLISNQKSEIISAISHEFKNPIATIIGYAQTINSDPSMDSQTREKFLTKIEKNSQKISHMIDRLSLATRLETSEFLLQTTSFNFYELINEVVESFRVTNKNRKIVFDGDTTIIEADRQMIELVVANLIQNALKYSNSDININLKDRIFSVEDFGIGIKKSDIDKITQKFYRLNSQSWDNSLGLGLSFVANILKLHGTHIEIASMEGKGSIFSFKI